MQQNQPDGLSLKAQFMVLLYLLTLLCFVFYGFGLGLRILLLFSTAFSDAALLLGCIDLIRGRRHRWLQRHTLYYASDALLLHIAAYLMIGVNSVLLVLPAAVVAVLATI